MRGSADESRVAGVGSVSMEWQGESDKGSQIQDMGAAGVVTGQGPGDRLTEAQVPWLPQ